MKKDKLLKLAAFLDTLEEDKFDLAQVAISDDEDPMCGSVCCAVGWTPKIFPEEVRWAMPNHYEGLDLACRNEGGDWVVKEYREVAVQLFEITEAEAHSLFTPYQLAIVEKEEGDYDRLESGELRGALKPKQMAERIRMFAEAKEQLCNKDA